MEPGRLIASGRDGDIFEFGPGLVLRRRAAGVRSRPKRASWSTHARQGYPVPEIHELRSDGTEIVMERIDGPLMSDAILRRLWTMPRVAQHCSRTSTISCTRSPAPSGCARCPTAATRSSISTCTR